MSDFLDRLIDKHCGCTSIADLENVAIKQGWPMSPIMTNDEVKTDPLLSMVAYWYCSYAEVLEELRKVKPPKLVFMKTLESNPCSASCLQSNENLIVMSKGAIGSIISSVKRMTMTIQRSKYFQIISYYDPIAYTIKEIEKSYSHFEKELKKSKTNELFWIPLFWMTFVLRCMHEVGHHVNGHLNFKRRRRKNIESLNNIELSLLNRTLEFDADAFVASEGINYILGRYKIPPIFSRIEQMGRTHEITLLQTSVIMLCQSPSILFPYDELTHPNSHDFSRWRALHILGTIKQCFIVRNNIEDLEIIEKTQKNIIDLIDFSSHDNLASRYEPTKNEDIAYRHNLSQILSCWSAIRTSITDLKIGTGKSTPAQLPPDPRFVFEKG